MAKKPKRRKSIFTRLVVSYMLFLVVSMVVFLIVGLLLLSYLGNGSIDNASPQTVVKNDGTINDMEVLERIGGWVEELDDEGNVVNVIGEKRTDKDSYTMAEMANFVDLGFSNFNSSGIIISKGTPGEMKEYSACARYVGEPRRIFLVFYPTNMVNYKLSFMITNNQDGKASAFKWLFLVAFAVEILGISLYLKKHIDKPLKHLMAGMEEVSEGKRDVVIDYKTDREFEDIRDRFNCMAKKLKESEDEKHRLEQSRNQMLLELAHDIKNPVAAIKSSILAIEEGLVSDDKKADYYRTIEMKAERICTLTEDMNTSLKMESDDYKLNLEKTDVCEVVRRISAEFYEELTDNGKEFDIDIPDDAIFANLDVKLFGRVINNLLANANKYNVTGENISVKVGREDVQDSAAEDGSVAGDEQGPAEGSDAVGNILVEVSDDGEAIDESFVPRLFEAFSRGDKTRKTDGGTGLGLAIAHKIVEKHGGSLEYALVDGRNTFRIIIPQYC